ncbi:MAG: MFS transporter, partial [Chloroflexi bacterium]|nr:MFS transporter [Chloroflexota bacterium]
MAIAARLATHRPYYGWYIVGVLFVSSFISSGLSTYATAVIMKPMTQELGWSRGFFSAVVYLATVISSPLSMLLWPVVDRRGARGVMLVSGLILGVGTASLGLVDSRWQFILIKSVIMPFGTVGVGGMVGMMVVTNWFIRKRGRGLAITAMGMSTAGIAMTPVATFLVSEIGWRHSWEVLGLGALVLNVVPAALFMRRRPEDLGLLPDGDT